MKFKTVEQVFEAEQGEWVYRFRQFEKGVTVSRVPKDSQLWGHGIIKQFYDKSLNQFVPTIKANMNSIVFKTMEEAVSAIEQVETV